MLNIYDNPLLRQYAVVIVVNLSVLCTGLGLAWPSPVLVKLRNSTETVLSRPITEEEGSWIVSIGFLVGLIANFFVAYLLDRLGRKPCVLIAAAPKVAVGILFTFATQPWMLLVGRAISGVSDIFIFNVIPIYASEIASTKIRGSLGTILQIMCSLGIVIMLCMGPFISYVTLNAIYTTIMVVTFIPLMFLPESPYTLYTKGRTAEATKVLTFLRGSDILANEEIKEYAFTKTDVKVSKREMFKSRTFLKGLGIVAILGIGTQLVGFNAVTFYLQTVLESTQTSVRPETSSVIIGLIQLTASVCTTLVTDKFGRKAILSVTLVGMTLGMIGLGAFFKVKETTDQITGLLNYLPLISLILVVYCYSAGLGSVNWALSAELFDGPSRAFGLALTSLLSTGFVFLTTKYFALVTEVLGPALTYWVFSVNCVLLCLFILFCVPETKGKTFAEIQDALGAKSSPDDEEKADK